MISGGAATDFAYLCMLSWGNVAAFGFRKRIESIKRKGLFCFFFLLKKKENPNPSEIPKIMQKQYLECGKIVSTHGVLGELRVQPWCDSPDFLLGFETLYLDQGNKALPVERARVQKNMLLLKPKGVDCMDDAVALRGKILYIDRAEAPMDDGEHFVQDLIGLRVLDADTGEEYGKLSNVFFTGANDVYELTDQSGKKKLIPAIKDVVLETDVAGGVMRIRPLKGLFDDAH